MAYWQQQLECMEREELEQLQSDRLLNVVRRMYENLPYYREKMQAAGLRPEDIHGRQDLYKLPFTTKQDLNANYPFGNFAVPMDRLVRIHASSGTTGRQTVVAYTQKDINMWTDCMARALTAAGVVPGDRMHVAYGYGLFTGGMGFHYGGEAVGAAVIPVSGGNTRRQIQLLLDFKATVLCSTPSYALYLAEEMERQGITKDDLHLRIGVFGAEPWSEQMREQLNEQLGIQSHDIYGLSEIMGPGVAVDCGCGAGLHIAEDKFIVEVIDPETEEVLPPGSQGELVFTCLEKEALPLIRYRTHDLSALHLERCACGRTLARMEKVRGRSDDMLVIRGVNVFPTQIESVLLRFNEIMPHYMIYVDTKDLLDVMEIHVEMKQDLFTDEVKKIEDLSSRLSQEINSILGIKAKIKLVEPYSLERTSGKAKRVIDRRKT